MKELLDSLQERMKFLKSEQAKRDVKNEIQLEWRIRELSLAIIVTQQKLLEQVKPKSVQEPV